MSALSSPLTSAAKNDGTIALVKSGSEIVKTTPAGEYLTAALNDFDPDQYEGHAAISDGANKLLMLVLAAVIKAGASREHEILAEIRDSVFSFIRKMEPKRVLPVECFLEKANTGRSRSSSRGNSPGRSPVQYVDEQIQRFKVNLKPEKKSKFSSVVLKIRGIDQEIWRQQLELLSTAIMDGWMAGLGAALPPNTDALGQLLFEYSKRVYTSQLQHLKDIAGTLATKEAEDAAQVAKLRSALESVDHKRRKILQQMRSDVALLTLENGGSPILNPSTAAEDARLVSLISLDGILKQDQEYNKTI
ncbi:Kinesin-like protein KIN-14B [Lathyrus oleraceus]|uniref:Kinesin-like protein KIN-14B n=1 Tax=Pisum sativum TaxID=3888 RepID=A0A9D4XG42_PEA|nr:Kinesin-like protein KIN-14B [Pisum sativum]